MLQTLKASEPTQLTQDGCQTKHPSSSFSANIILIYLLGSGNLAFAGNHPLLNEADFLADIPVVSVASRLKQNLHNTPASVTVLDRATISASGAQTLPDLLRLVPGFQVFHVNANKLGASYHGMNDEFPNQLEVMVNGRSVYLPLLSTVIWTSLGLHPDDIERVEVVRGSNAATYGSNAFMGAVNFITRHPATEARFSASGTLGSKQTQNGHLRYSGESQGAFYRISASHESNAGSTRFNDSAQRQFLSADLSFAPSLYDTLNLHVGMDQGYTHLGYLYPYHRFPDNQHYISRSDYRANYQQINWSHLLTPDTTLHISAYRNALVLNESRPTVEDILTYYLPEGLQTQAMADSLQQLNPEFRGYREHGKTHVLDTEVALETHSHNLSSFTGLGLRRDAASSPVLLQQIDIRDQRYRLFHSSEFQLTTKTLANLGVIHEVQSGGSKATSTRAAVSRQLSDDTSIRIGYSHSERLASILERQGNYRIELPPDQFHYIDRPNTELEPERIQSWEVGLLHSLTPLNGYIDLRIFHERISDAIVNVKQADEAGMRMNRGYWRNQGLEAQLKLQPNDSFWLIFNYSYLDNQAGHWHQGHQPDEFTHFPGGQLAPKHTLSALLNWQLTNDVNLSSTYYFMDEVRWRGSYGTLAQQEHYQRLDLKLTRQWRTASQKIELSAIVQNALHGSYQSFYQDNEFDPRAFLQFRLTMD
ncbi:TonB-dependent receptor plug domain-containing protein [Nitrincola iocasae]|uniref:TonB-dependent receptor plug domain-containing protein n=1 Tax=Nitrincola iocasae TaxID=2614693 RepID=A0A5J6LA91_9GAMM|nr:TonB-dependent receptor plug domain-containing protein [Nitrincola iocasae]QEW05415.1 TonB-dependent receptor plug domain-containing protein [Nitrincola iocasae]